MRRWLMLVALVALAGLPAQAVLIPVGATLPDCSPEATALLSFNCTNLAIPVNTDQAKLDATLYMPKAASQETPVAAMLMTHGYGGWHRSGGDIGHATMWANAGYAVLSYTSRGFGRSEGTVALESPEGEVRDAMDLITWLATPANTGGKIVLDGPGDPRIGMSGGSYAGGIQLLVAAQDPAKRLDAIAPQITWNDLRYSLAPNGVVHHGWIDLLYASGKYAGYFGPIGAAPIAVSTEGVPADQDVQILTNYLTNENIEMPVPYSDGTSSSYEYLARRSVGPIAGNVTTPMLLVQGQHDTLFTLNEAFRTLASVSTPEADKKLIVFSGGHGYPELEGERAMINVRLLAWMDKYLNGNPTAAIGPAVEVWRPWVPGANFGAPGEASTYSWSIAAPVLARLANVPAPTSHSEVTNFQNQTGSPTVDAGEGVTAHSEVFDLLGERTVFGSPEVRFTISTAAPEAIVFVKLWDEDASGARTLIHRMVAPVRVRAGLADFCSQFLPSSMLNGAGVQTDEACVTMPGISWKFAAGHKAVVTLATSDTMFFGSRFPGVYDIMRISLVLPVVPAF